MCTKEWAVPMHFLCFPFLSTNLPLLSYWTKKGFTHNGTWCHRATIHMPLPSKKSQSKVPSYPGQSCFHHFCPAAFKAYGRQTNGISINHNQVKHWTCPYLRKHSPNLMITRTLIDLIQYRNHRLFNFIPIPYKLAEWTQARIKHATYPKSLTVVDPPLATLHCAHFFP